MTEKEIEAVERLRIAIGTAFEEGDLNAACEALSVAAVFEVAVDLCVELSRSIRSKPSAPHTETSSGS